MTDIEELKRQRAAARGRMRRADKVRQHLLSKLCRLNAEFQNARADYLFYDREIAEEEKVTVLPPKKERKRPQKKEPEMDEKTKELAQKVKGLTAEQLATLESMLEKE